MKKYHITALGNALVDIEFQVNSDFFSQHDIEKGVMTLIEKDKHLSLLSSLNNGYTMRKRAGGGSAANTVVTAANFGASTFYCCKVGDDEFGQFYRKDLKDAGVEHALAQQNDTGETGKCIVMVTDDADRTMNTFLGVTATLNKQQIVADAIKNSEYFYIEGHLMYNDDAVAAIIEAKRIAKDNGVKVALTVSDPAVIKYVRPNLERVLAGGGIDLLFCNDEEATDYGNGCIEKGIAALRQFTSMLVVTHGKYGASIHCAEQGVVDIAPYPVVAADTTGAGDTFAGAFLYGITHGFSLNNAGALANRTAAECVSQFGPRLEKSTQLDIFNTFVNH